MSSLHHVNLTSTTNSGGGFTKNHTSPIYGFLYAIEWVDGDFADGVDAVISMQDTPSGVAKTLLTLTNADNDAWYQPRDDEHNNAGSTTGGKCYPLLNGIPRLVVTNGGDTKTGGCVLHYFT